MVNRGEFINIEILRSITKMSTERYRYTFDFQAAVSMDISKLQLVAPFTSIVTSEGLLDANGYTDEKQKGIFFNCITFCVGKRPKIRVFRNGKSVTMGSTAEGMVRLYPDYIEPVEKILGMAYVIGAIKQYNLSSVVHEVSVLRTLLNEEPLDV